MMKFFVPLARDAAEAESVFDAIVQFNAVGKQWPRCKRGGQVLPFAT
jgi:hypothetical protein